MNEFTLPKGWRIVTFIACLGLLGLSAFLISLIIGSEVFLWIHLFYASLAIGFAFLAFYGYRDAQVGKLIIAEDHVRLVGPFGTRTLLFDEIKGYRKIQNYFVLEAEDPAKKNIKISTYLAGQHDIQEFLYVTFENLDVLDQIEQQNEIYSNHEFGVTEEVRAERHAKVMQITKWVNRIAWVVTVWALFFPTPYNAAVLTCMVYPFLALLLCYHYRGWMKVEGDEKSVYPSVAEAFILPSIALALRALLDISTIDYSNGWLLVAVFGIGLYILYMIPTGGFKPRNKNGYVLMAIFPLFTAFYSFGFVISINKIADSSTPQEFPTTVVKKRIDSGKITTYHLVLSPWGELTENEEVKVSKSEFDSINIDEQVTVYQYEGFLKMPWIEVGINPGQ